MPSHAATLDINFDTDPTAFFEKTGGNPDPNSGIVGPEWRATDGNPATGGYLKLTDAIDSMAAAIVFKDADAGKIVTGFTFTCDVRIGNDFGDADHRAADGFSISFARGNDPFLASDPLNTGLMAAGLPEAGTTTGLAVSFDAWAGNALPDGPDVEGVLVRLDNRTIGTAAMAVRNGACTDQNSLQTGNNDDSGTTAPLCWQPLEVTLATDGKLTVKYKGRTILNAFQTGFVPSPGRLVFAGRTGGNNQIQHVDNVKLTTTVSTTPIVSALAPGLKSFSFQIFDSGDSIVDPTTLVVKNGATVLNVESNKVDNVTTVTYTQTNPYASGSTQNITVDFKDTTGATIPTVTRSFVIPAYAQVYSIGLNFGASEPLTTGHLVDPADGTVLAGLAPDDVAGLAAVAQGAWNNMVDLDNRTTSGPNGSLTGIQVFNKGNTETSADTYVEWHASGTWTSTAVGTAHTENNNNFAAGADRIMMTGYLDTGNATTTRITVTNLPAVYGANGYDLYVYFLGGANVTPPRGGGYRILTTDGVVLKNYLFGDTPQSANPTVYVQDVGANHTDTGNYLKFSGLVARDIVIEATTENGLGNTATPRAPVNGVQLVAGANALTAPVVGDVNFTPARFFFTISDVPSVSVDPASITVRLDGATTNIPVTITKSGGITTVSYDSIADRHAFFTVGGHTNFVSFNGGAAIQKPFTIAAYTTVDARTALPFDAGDSTKPGFRARLHGYDPNAFIRGPGDRNQTIIVERALNLGYNDPLTADPLPDIFADAAGKDEEGFFDVTGPLNFNFAGGDAGLFTAANNHPEEVSPLPLDGGSVNYEVEFVTYLKLPMGYYRFAVNSDDGFRASIAPGQDAAGGQILGQFNGGRGVGSPTFFDFAIPQDGVYPVRLSYWQGTGGESIEFYAQDILTGELHLINAPETGAIVAYRSAVNARPSIRRALPVQNWIGGYANDDVIIESRDDTNGPVKVDANSVKLYINNTLQTTDVTVTQDGPVTKLVRKGSLSNLLPSGVNTIRYVRNFTGGTATETYTNEYNINVAPYYGVIPASYRVPADQIDTTKTGFHAYVDQMDKTRNGNQGDGGRITGGGNANRMPRPEQQLAGSEISAVTGQRFPNIANAGPNQDWTYTFDLFNFKSPLDTASVGLFTTTLPPAPNPGLQLVTDPNMPGLPGTGTSNGGVDNYVMEATTYLDLKKGVYVFGINSDDGFVVNAGADPHDTLGQLLGFANLGRGNSGNLVGPSGTSPYTTLQALGVDSGSTPFNVIVPEDGIYPIRVLYWQGGGGVNAEFFMLNKESGQVVLVNDLASASWVPAAYYGYNGTAKPWTRFSVSPTPWENRVQQAGPDQLKIWGRTTTTVGAIAGGDYSNDNDARRPFANVGIGGVVANGSTEDVRILLDGTDVTAGADITTTGTDKKVVYQPGKGTNPLLGSGSTHTASLVYAGGTNSWTFRVGQYVVAPDTNRLDFAAVNAADRGFKIRVAQGPDTPALATTVARAEAQLAGTPADTFSTKGPEPDGGYIVTNGIINYSIARNRKTDGSLITPSGVEIGNFESKSTNGLISFPFGDFPDQPFPGVAVQGNSLQNFSAEITGWVQFDKPGFYRWGFNGDDGVRVQLTTNVNLTASNQSGVDSAQTNPNVLFSWDRGGGSADIPFGFVIPTAGIYPLRIVYFQGGGGANFEMFSYDDDQTGMKIPLNDPNNPKAIKVYFRATDTSTPQAPVITVTTAGGNITITWTNGGELLTATDVAGPWSGTGDTDGSFTEPIGTGNKFYQIRRAP